MRANIVIDDELMKEVMELTGCKSESEAVREALQTLRRVKLEEKKRFDKGRQDRFGRIMAIGRRCAARPVLDDRSADEIIGYDKNGLPQ